MVKRVVGKKEKVAKAVDKCIRSVGKRVNACRSPHRAFAHVALQSLRWASILRGLRFYQAQRCASYHLLIAPAGAGSAREKRRFLALALTKITVLLLV